MDPQAEERHSQLQAQLAEYDKHSIERLQRLEREHELYELRMARAGERADRAEARMDRAEARMDRFDKQLQATKKLVEAGMKIVVRLGTRIDETNASVKELAETQRAFIRAMGNGHKGRSGHTGPGRHR